MPPRNILFRVIGIRVIRVVEKNKISNLCHTMYTWCIYDAKICTHGVYMVYTWYAHGVYILSKWCVHGAYMVHT